MTIVQPARMIHDRIKTDAFDLHTVFGGSERFTADIAKPFRAQVVFDASLGDEERTLVAVVYFFNDISERLVARILLVDESLSEDPLIVHVVVGADRVEVLWRAAELRLQTP